MCCKRNNEPKNEKIESTQAGSSSSKNSVDVLASEELGGEGVDWFVFSEMVG